MLTAAAAPLLFDGRDVADDVTKSLPERIDELRSEMPLAAEQLEFERAAELRDRIKKLESQLDAAPAPKRDGGGGGKAGGSASGKKSAPAKAAGGSRGRRR